MLNQVETNTLTVTPAAAQAFQNILTERNLEGYALRVYVAGSGCSGVQFGMALDNAPRDDDHAFESGGISMLIDRMSWEYLQGAKVDFVTDPQRGAGFLIDSPIAKSMGGSCGCGSKGENASEASDEGGCACGGSCGCN
jgi:iron-sulfur cluster assembly accessory protein